MQKYKTVYFGVLTYACILLIVGYSLLVNNDSPLKPRDVIVRQQTRLNGPFRVYKPNVGNPLPYAIHHKKRNAALVFIKTHKTGSTTLSWVIERYGFVRNLSFLYFKNDKVHGHFRNMIPKNASAILPPLGVVSGDYTNYRDYDMSTTHIRLLPNREFFHRFMNKSAKTVTILREPSSQWESALFFFGCSGRRLGISKNDSQGSNPKEYAVDKFLSNADSFWSKWPQGMCKWYAKNGMWYDMSTNRSIHDDTAVIRDLLRTLDEQLDLVLITEYMDESLLLLRKMMGWDYDDIVYLRMNERRVKTHLSETQRAKIREWNMGDVLLYDHFNKTLWRKVDEYGRRKFNLELEFFRKKQQKLTTMCGVEHKLHTNRNGVSMFIAKNASDLCQNLVRDQNWYQHEIIARQTNNISIGEGSEPVGSAG